jgi:hypothetical protein
MLTLVPRVDSFKRSEKVAITGLNTLKAALLRRLRSPKTQAQLRLRVSGV